MNRRSLVYLDHNATTPLAPEVAAALAEHADAFGNPSSRHLAGEEARELVEAARAQVARLVGAVPAQVVFTGSGTEADNMAIKGIALKPDGRPPTRGFCPLTRLLARSWDRWRARFRQPVHIITSQIEHSAVLATCQYLEALGHRVTYVPVGAGGRVDPEDVRRALRADTRLISIMHANNETGVIQPIAELAALARLAGIPFHTDACQSAGKLALDDLAGGLLSFSAQKMYGPKGVGALVVPEAIALEPLLHGGSQEHGLRAGTENVLGIVGFGVAAELAGQVRIEEAERETRLRNRLLKGLQELADVRVNGDARHLLPGTLNVSFRDVRGNAMASALALEGIAVSTGSACHAGKQSHVLQAMGVPEEWLHGAIRFSLGRATTAADIDRVLAVTPRVIDRLRKAAPLARAS